MKQNKKAGRMIIIFLAVFCLSLIPVLAEDYSGTVNIGRLSAEGNSSNYTARVFDGELIGAVEGNSSNYTVRFEAFDYEANPNIPPVVVEEDPDEGRSSSGSSSTSSFSWPTTPTPTEPVVKDISYGSLVSSTNKTMIVENKQKQVVLEKVEIKLQDNLTGEKKNVLIQIVQVGETKTRKESLSFFGYKYKMLEINHEDVKNEEIKSAKIDFSVLDTWLQEQGITKEDIILFRYNNNVWQELKTIYEDANATHHFYSALSPGLSSFMIGTREDVVKKTTNDITGNIVDDTTETNTNTTITTGTDVQNTTTEATNEEDTSNLELFGLKKAILFLFIGILLAVLIIGGTAFAMKHKHLHPSKSVHTTNTQKAPKEQKTPPQEVTTQKPVQQKVIEEPDFVDTLTGHIDAKAQEIAGQVEQVTKEETTNQQQTHPQIKTTSVRQQQTQENTTKNTESAPKELDFTGHEEESLTQYVKQVISAGYEKELYVKALLVKGWTKEQIDYCVEKVIHEQVETPDRMQTK